LRQRKAVVRRITVINFGVKDGGDNGTGCCRIEAIGAETAKLMNIIIAGFKQR